MLQNWLWSWYLCCHSQLVAIWPGIFMFLVVGGLNLLRASHSLDIWWQSLQVLLPKNMTQEALRVVAEYFGLTPLVEILNPPPTPPSIQPRTHFPDILPLDVRGRWANPVKYLVPEVFWTGKSMSTGHFWPATRTPTLLKCSRPIPDIRLPGLHVKYAYRPYQSPGTDAWNSEESLTDWLTEATV